MWPGLGITLFSVSIKPCFANGANLLLLSVLSTRSLSSTFLTSFYLTPGHCEPPMFIRKLEPKRGGWMRKFIATVQLVSLALAFHAYAAGEYRPGFNCPRPDNSDLLAVYICTNQAMAREELIFEKTYYAHRQQDGVQAYRNLKLQAINYNAQLRAVCGIPATGGAGLMPPTGPACYVTQTDLQVANWNASLHGDALEEAARDIDIHIAAQQQLIELGFLPPKSTADGVYGDSTRIAIVRWQEKNGLVSNGFLSDTEVSSLLSGAGSQQPVTPAPQTPQRLDPSPSPGNTPLQPLNNNSRATSALSNDASKPPTAQELLKELGIFDTVSSEAEHICGSVSEVGTSRTVDWSLEVQGGGLPQAITKIVGLGVSGAARYERVEWTGILQQDLGLALQDTRDCKQHVFDTMTRDLFSPPANADANRTVTVDETKNVGNFDPHSLQNADGSSLTYRVRGPFREKNGSSRISIVLESGGSARIFDDIGLESPDKGMEGGSVALSGFCLDTDNARGVIVFHAEGGGNGNPQETYLGRFDKDLTSFRIDEFAASPPDMLCQSGQSSDLPSPPYPKVMSLCSCAISRPLSIATLAADFAREIQRGTSEGSFHADLDKISPGNGERIRSSSADINIVSFLKTISMLPEKYKHQFLVKQLSNGPYYAILIEYTDVEHYRWAALLGGDQRYNSWATYFFDDHEETAISMSHPYPTLLDLTAEGEVSLLYCEGSKGVQMRIKIGNGESPGLDGNVVYDKVFDTGKLGEENDCEPPQP